MRRPSATRPWLAALLAAVLCGAAGAAAQDRPQRVVSLNLCTDQLALMLEAPGQVVSVTFLALRAESSYMAGRARGRHINRGQAEEVLALKPDLVLAGTAGAQPTVRLLERLGYRVERFAIPDDFAAVRRQVRRMARLMGVPGRGAALLAGFDRARVAGAGAVPAAARPAALLYQANGLTAGRETIVDQVLTAAGLRNLAGELGIRGVARLPLEQMLWAGPDVLVFSSYAPGAPSLGEALTGHPAVARFSAPRRVIRIPARLWLCPGPMLAEAVTLLRGLPP